MGLLDKIERAIERLLEGTTGRMFRQKLQPAEIGRHLERAMLSNRRASVGAQMAPNDYVVHLHPTDYEQVASFSQGLSRQMEAHLAQVARRNDLALIERLTVKIVEDERAKKRTPSIVATITDRVQGGGRREPHRGSSPRYRDPSPPPQHTTMFEAQRSPSSNQATLVVVEGPETGATFPLREGQISIGRSSENDIVLASHDVSRHHARLVNQGNLTQIHDNNSSNGTRVNGELVHIADLRDGDHLQFGGTVLRLDMASSHDTGWR